MNHKTPSWSLRGLSMMIAVGLALALPVSLSGDTPVETVQRLHEKGRQITTAHFTQVIKSSGPMAESISNSEVWQKRKADGTIRMRTEMTSEMTYKGLDMPPQKSESIMVMDGEFVWSEIRMSDSTMVTKMNAPPEAQMGLMHHVDNFEKGEGRLLEPETIDGVRCVVFEYNMEDMSGGMSTVYRGWIDEESGMMIKSLMKGDDMVGTTEMRVENVRIGIDIDDEKVTYTPPEGVDVMDYTGMF